MNHQQKIAIVTGANRGIGFEVCRQLAKDGAHVILTARDSKKGERATEALRAEGLDVEFHRLDVTNDEMVHELREFVTRKFGRVDILVNNAGILIDNTDDPSFLKASLEAVRQSFETNTLGSLRMCQAFVPMMLKNGYGRIVNLSSGMGQLSEMNGGYPAYRLSKTAVNAITRLVADEVGKADVLINSVCPGWVKTDMGGTEAERTLEEGADTVVWLAELPKGGPTGGFFRDRKPIAW